MSGIGSRALRLIDELIDSIDNHPRIRPFSTNAQEFESNNITFSQQSESQSQSKQKLSKSQQKKLKKEKAKAQKKKFKNEEIAAKQASSQDPPKTSRRKQKKEHIAEIELPPPIIDKNGKKSTLTQEMAKTYNPSQVEACWDKWWESKDYYKPSIESNDDTFVMVIPPPNVTGSLHLGHALMATIEDCITRYWRMKGLNCLWLPGTDHAGIATQTVVERRLMKDEGKSRIEYGRDEFLKRVWKWKDEYGGQICEQLRKMGCSVDWSREVFTMDKKLNIAVTEAFVRMYEKKLIYRENRLCHWSCTLQSAISNAEVEPIQIEKPTLISVPGYKKKVKFGIIHHFRYPIADSKNNETIEVATTRLETMLGDTAVAIHPDDKRYKHFHGKFVQHPFCHRKIPIILDSKLVNMEFGTGAVKVTPAHDENDFECGKRNNLEFINIFTDDGKINENGYKFAGLPRFEARIQVRKELKSLGLSDEDDEKENPMGLGICSRSKDIIEPLLKPQWWVNCDNMAKRALEVVDKKELIIRPQEGIQQWHYFLDNIRPWCISRQLWWGHRIPAWLICLPKNPNDPNCKPEPLDNHNTNNWIIARNEIEAYKKVYKKYSNNKYNKNQIILQQDPDVLDTWFSSGLFPFSTMGWPNENNIDFKKFFPGTLLETGGDIIFFWVARMVMMSLELFNFIPFREVFLHPMVRDKYGKKNE